MINGYLKKLREIKKFLESNERENSTYLGLWDTTETVLRSKFVTTSAYIEKPETSQINVPQSLRIVRTTQS
jgi:hypothetical protein